AGSRPIPTRKIRRIRTAATGTTTKCTVTHFASGASVPTKRTTRRTTSSSNQGRAPRRTAATRLATDLAACTIRSQPRLRDCGERPPRCSDAKIGRLRPGRTARRQGMNAVLGLLGLALSVVVSDQAPAAPPQVRCSLQPYRNPAAPDGATTTMTVVSDG